MRGSYSVWVLFNVGCVVGGEIDVDDQGTLEWWLLNMEYCLCEEFRCRVCAPDDDDHKRMGILCYDICAGSRDKFA